MGLNQGAVEKFALRAAEVGAQLWPAIVEIAGAQYPATVPEPRLTEVLADGGGELVGELVARVAVAAMPNGAAVQQGLKWKRPGETEWRADRWWIVEVRRGPLETEWRVGCEGRN
jgi:hypothetical protein